MRAPALLDLLLLVAEQALDEVFHVPLVLDGDEHAAELLDLLPAELERLVAHVLRPVPAGGGGQDPPQEGGVVLGTVVVVREPGS